MRSSSTIPSIWYGSWTFTGRFSSREVVAQRRDDVHVDAGDGRAAEVDRHPVGLAVGQRGQHALPARCRGGRFGRCHGSPHRSPPCKGHPPEQIGWTEDLSNRVPERPRESTCVVVPSVCNPSRFGESRRRSATSSSQVSRRPSYAAGRPRMVTSVLWTLGATVGLVKRPSRMASWKVATLAGRPLPVDVRGLPAAIELLAADQHLAAVLGFQHAARAEHAVADALRRPVPLELPPAELHADAVRVGVEHDEVVRARANPRSRLQPAAADGRDGRHAHDPVHHVQRVDVLLGDVSPESARSRPHARTQFSRVAGASCSRSNHCSNGTSVVVGRLAEHDVAEGPAVDARHGLDVEAGWRGSGSPPGRRASSPWPCGRTR